MDLTYLNEISGGDEDFIKDMIETFLDETPKDIEQLQSHLKEENWAELGDTAHKLKSSIKMFGFPTLKDQVLSLENDGKNAENLDSISERVGEFMNGLQSAMEELKSRL